MKLGGRKGITQATHRYLIAEHLNGPEPEPEYRECPRCGVRMNPTSLIEQCTDCKGLNAFKANNKRQQEAGKGNFLPVDPAYEVALHYPAIAREDPTAGTLDALRIPYFSYYGTKDPLEFEYARSLHANDIEPRWPIVLITSHGEPIDHWDGFDLNKLNAIPAARAAATTPTEAALPCVPDSQEQAA